jgi:hypothetical protein
MKDVTEETKKTHSGNRQPDKSILESCNFSTLIGLVTMKSVTWSRGSGLQGFWTAARATKPELGEESGNLSQILSIAAVQFPFANVPPKPLNVVPAFSNIPKWREGR